ncbi:hypothetical protein [Cohnella sp. GCM10012308]|uniref:hypothetical protein n=1 Tax=Cohnella sp. GCM10012308 TaxID=3317329 RepID=UPI003622FF61
MTDTVNKQALDIIASRERQQREYGNPVNLEIARELRAIIQDIKELPPTPSTPVQGCREALDIELALLQMWERNDIQEIFKYKRRIHYFRERLSNIELFYDLSFVLFADVDDIASKDITPEEGKVSVAELIRKRQALSQTDIQLISAEQELDIVRSAKDSLMRYTQKCRTERDYWQTRAIDAEQELSNLKNGPGINSTEDDQPGPSVDIISSVDFSPVPPEKQAIIEKAFDAAFSSTEEEETDV